MPLIKATAFRNINITGWLLVLYFLFLPLSPLVSIVSLIVLAFFVFFNKNYGIVVKRIRNDRILKIFLFYYLLHIIGLIYSENLQYGINDLVTKLTFLVTPLVFAGLNLDAKTLDRIKFSFVVSAILTLLLFLTIACSHYLNSGDLFDFFYTRLAYKSHTTYITIYFNLALVIILEQSFNSNRKYSGKFLTACFLFIFCGILILSARTSTMVAVFTVLLFPVLVKGRSLLAAINLKKYLVILFSMALLFLTYLKVYNRFTQVENFVAESTMKPTTDSLKTEVPNSTNIRAHLWKNATQLIGRNVIWGVGTGDIKEELVNIYKENNYEYGVKERISPHNQFLHTGVILGLVGIILLLIYLLWPMYLSFKSKDWMYFSFLLIIFINCMTESILERQAGILFFTAFNSLFYLHMKYKNEIN